MRRVVFELWHFLADGPAPALPNLARAGGKLVGTFATPALARRTIRAYGRKPGFRSWPRGFRILAVTVDQAFWRRGFHHGIDGDFTEGGDPSPQRGLIGALALAPGHVREFGGRDDVWRWQTRPPSRDRPLPDLWRLDHFQIDRSSRAARPEAGEKRIGLFRTLPRAIAAAALRRTWYGFRDWPDGFRIRPVRLGQTAWPDGFEPGVMEDQSLGRPRKPGAIHALVHFRAGPGTDIPNADDGDMKGLGTFRTAREALAAIPPYRHRPGFGDWPDGFRVLRCRVGEAWWREGFRSAPGGDEAVAGDPSPVRGTDDALGCYPEEMDRREERPGAVAHFHSPAAITRALWEVEHYKVPAASSQAYEDMGFKRIGLFAGEAEARAAVADRLSRPGFRDWPGGFRIGAVWADGRTAWESGFGPAWSEEEAPPDPA